MGSEDLAEYAVVSSRLLLYLVEPVRVVRLCLRVGFSRLMRRIIVCLSVGRGLQPLNGPARRSSHSSFGCFPPPHPSFLSSPSSSNPPGPLTLLPDNPPTLQSAAPAQGSLTLRSSESPDPPTAISDPTPQTFTRPAQRAPSTQSHSLTCVQPQLGRRTRSSVWTGPTAASNLQPTTNYPL